MTSEAEALQQICSWALSRPAWQQDALRRLCGKDEMTETDLDELVALCKGEGGKGKPLTKDHVSDPKAAGASVTLRSLRDIQGVNALAEGQRLTFEKTGVTVVYGDNGAGKSGYARVLKRVCRARQPKEEAILRNIYRAQNEPQRGVIEFSASGQNQSETWEEGKGTTPLLSAISVFDSNTASTHVSATNELAYIPFPIRLLERLAQTSQVVKGRLNQEIRTLRQQTPEALRTPSCSENSEVGKLLKGLSKSTKPDTVESLATLTPEEQARFQQLRADLAADPANAARQLRAQKGRLEGIRQSVTAVTDASTEEAANALRGLYDAYAQAKNAAKLAADELFTEDPLPSVGSETWKQLWEAARAYSTREAYPEQAFPVTQEDARCVLCHQTLLGDAPSRLNRFEAFVQDETKHREDEAKSAYDNALKQLSGSTVSASRLREIRTIIEDEINDHGLALLVRKHLIGAKLRLRYTLRHHKQQDDFVLPSVSSDSSQALLDAASNLEIRATALLAEKDSQEHRALLDELTELEDRAWLETIKADVINEIERKKQIAKLETAVRRTSTTATTTKSSEISEELVTAALRGRFMQEVDRLGVAGLAIELRKERTTYGVPQFKISLIHKPEAPVGNVLSEGEHRCVALAGFLAELATSDSDSAIVFDDPVSSLDHLHREAVADRLAEEGQGRQVIVFTHDIAFLLLLNEACKAGGTHIGFRSVNRGRDFAGYCRNDAPANAQPVSAVIQAMQKQLTNQKVQFEQGDKATWYLTVRSLQEQLRTTWERAVEDMVAPVLRRLSNKVSTHGLAKLTAVTLQDCETMRKAYGRCSELLHSEADALNSPLPEPERIEAEIAFLQNWYDDLKNRQNAIDEA